MTVEWSPDAQGFFAAMNAVLEIAAPLFVVAVVVLLVKRLFRAS